MKALLAAALLLLACGGPATPTTSAPRAPATQAPSPAEPPPAAETIPSPSPAPLTYSGRGSRVLTVSLAAGDWRASWSASGSGPFRVVVEAERTLTIVDTAAPSVGEEGFMVAGGSYQLTIDAKGLEWRLTLALG